MKKLFYLLFTIIFLCTSPSYSKEQKEDMEKIALFNIPFFEKFNDEILIKNLFKVYENNNDLKAVNLKVSEAKRLVKLSLANELPYIGFDGYINHTFNSSDERYGSMMIPDFTQTRFLLPLTMNYEIDLWGKNRLKTKSYKKRLEMMEQDEKAVYIALSSAFTVNYYNLIKTDSLIELQKQLIETQEKISSSIKTKYELGTATKLDVIKAEKALTYLKEELNSLSEKQDVLQNQISVLLSDREYSAIPRESFKNINFEPSIPQKIELTTLEGRPDWVKSQIDLERAGIDVKVAKRELLPKILIAGNLGFNMYNLSSANKFLADIALMPAIDIFSGGRKVQFLKLQKDEYELAIQNYDKVILTSMQETNDALYSLKNANRQKELTAKRLELDEEENKLTEEKYKLGTADNLNVLFKKEEFLITQKELVSSKINEIIATVELYQAVGGVDFTKENL